MAVALQAQPHVFGLRLPSDVGRGRMQQLLLSAAACRTRKSSLSLAVGMLSPIVQHL